MGITTIPNASSNAARAPESRILAKRQVRPSAERRVAYSRSRSGVSLESKLMLTSASFQDDPTPLVDMVRAYALLDGSSPRDTMRTQALERERETRRVVESLTPLQAAMLEALLPRTHAAIRYRERARLKQALLYSRCRRIALAMGEQLTRRERINRREDVFFFTYQELIAIADGALATNIEQTVRQRSDEHARQSAISPPDAFTHD